MLILLVYMVISILALIVLVYMVISILALVVQHCGYTVCYVIYVG